MEICVWGGVWGGVGGWGEVGGWEGVGRGWRGFKGSKLRAGEAWGQQHAKPLPPITRCSCIR